MNLWVIISVLLMNQGKAPDVVIALDPNNRGGFFHASKQDCEKELLEMVSKASIDMTLTYNSYKQLSAVYGSNSYTCVQLKGPFEPIK